MVKHKGLCPSLKKSVEFDVKEIVEIPTKRGIKYQVKGDFEGRTCSTFCSKAKAMELKKALGLDVMEAETEDGTGQAHQEEGVSPIENNVQPLAQEQEPMESMPVQETVSTPITNTSIGVEPIENLDLTDADALNNMATDFDKAPQMIADIEIAPSEPEGDGRSIGNIRPMNEDVPLHAESEDGTGQAHQEEGVSPIENNVQPLAQGQEPMEAMPVQETVSTPITNTSIGVEPIDNLGLDGADAIGSMTTEFDDAPEILANFQIGMMQPFGEGRSIGNNTPMNPDVPLHAEEFKAETEIKIIDPTDDTTLPTPPPVCFVDKIPPSVWENLSVLEKIHYAETGDESILVCPNCGISKEQLRLQDGFGVCGDCAYQKYFAPSHWITEPMIVENITEDEIELSERLPADVDMPPMTNPQKDLQTMIVPYFVWDKIYTQFTGGIKAEQDLSGLNYVLTYHGMMKPQLDNAIEVAEGEYDIMFGAERYQAQVFKAKNNQGYYLDAETVIPLTKKGKVRTMSGKPHTPRELKEDKDITPEEALMRKEMKAETFDVEFDDWAEQEMLTHGKDVSFKEWAKEEGKKHGDMDLTDWAEEEEESHDERYEAESIRKFEVQIKNDPEDIWETIGKFESLEDAEKLYFDDKYYDKVNFMQVVEIGGEEDGEDFIHQYQSFFADERYEAEYVKQGFEIEKEGSQQFGTYYIHKGENKIRLDYDRRTDYGNRPDAKEYPYDYGEQDFRTLQEALNWFDKQIDNGRMFKDFEAENFEAEGYIDETLIWNMRNKLEPPAQGYIMFASSSPEINIPYLLTKGYDRDEIMVVEYGGNETVWIPEKPPMRYGAENFEAEVVQYDVLKGKPNEGGVEYAEYISIHDSVNEAEKEARRESKNIAEDEAIYVVEERFDDETLESKPSTLMFSIEKARESEYLEAEGKRDIPSLKSVGILLGIGALGAYLAPQGVRNFLNRLNK